MNSTKIAAALRGIAAAHVALADAIESEDEKFASSPAEPPSEVLDSEGAGRIVGLHPKLVERRARSGEIPAHKLPGTRKWRFMRADLLRWLEENGRRAA